MQSNAEIFSNVEVKVYFYGSSYLSLYVDNILVYDVRGNQLINLQSKQQEIIAQANNTDDVNKITTNQTYFENTVVGWHTIDEPMFIDNWAGVKKIAELLKNNTNGKKLVLSIAGVWNGKAYDGTNVYRIDELVRRTNIEEVIMNNFLFDWPLNDNETNYTEYNITNMAVYHLDRMNNFEIPFVLNLQTGKWLALPPYNRLEKIPTSAQFKYTMFLGLLYGAKGIGISNYFYNSINENTTSSLVSFTELGGGLNDYSYTSLWSTIKNEISPLLKGTFGQTLKVLTQQSQYPGLNIATTSTINQQFIDKIEFTSGSGDGIIDLGFFTDEEDTDKKYFMAINRYYSNRENLKFSFQNLSTYKNWEVTDLVDTVKTTVLADANNKAMFYDTIS